MAGQAADALLSHNLSPWIVAQLHFEDDDICTVYIFLW